MSNKKISYAEFARALGVSRATISVNISRGHIIADKKNKKIDYTEPANKIWIENQIASGKNWDLNNIDNIGELKNVKKNSEQNKQLVKAEEKTKDEYTDKLRKIDFNKKLQDLKKLELQNKSEELKLKKIEGTLIPVDAVKTVFLFGVETFRTLYSQDINNLINILTTRLEVDNSVYRELQKDIAENIDSVLKSVKEKLIEGVENIVEEYKEVRGRGERR